MPGPNYRPLKYDNYEPMKQIFNDKKDDERTSSTAVITGIYAPKIRSNVESDIPGRNMAVIAIIPIKNSLIDVPMENCLGKFSPLVRFLTGGNFQSTWLFD